LAGWENCSQIVAAFLPERNKTSSICEKLLSAFSLVFCFQASMALKEQEQRAPFLVVEMEPVHGLMLMELFGSLVVMELRG
jgi:hypothetical protein